ncbi:MAG: hypothetical protein IJ613_11295 [Muribaculaceae bacterium]|nr:hypothetical protein [Muribaculaceae bacterium]
MKKFLSLLMMSLLCAGAWAAEVTFGPDFGLNNWTTVEQGQVYSWTKDGVTITFNRAGQSQDPETWSFMAQYLRMGKNNPYLEVSVQGKITAVNIRLINYYQLSNIVVNDEPFTILTNSGGVQTGEWLSEAGVTSLEITARNIETIETLSFTVEDTATGVNSISTDNVVSERYYDLQGRMVDASAHGVLIRQTISADGKVASSKVIR